MSSISKVTASLRAAPYLVALQDDLDHAWSADEPEDAGGNHIVRRIRLEGELNGEQRAQLLKVAEACPMHKLLTGEVRIATALE